MSRLLGAKRDGEKHWERRSDTMRKRQTGQELNSSPLRPQSPTPCLRLPPTLTISIQTPHDKIIMSFFIWCNLLSVHAISLQRRQLFSLTLTKREVKHAMSQQLYCLDNRRNARDVSSFVRSISEWRKGAIENDGVVERDSSAREKRGRRQIWGELRKKGNARSSFRFTVVVGEIWRCSYSTLRTEPEKE